MIVILNALRALTGGLERVPRVPGWSGMSARLRAEHRELAPSLARIRPLADRLGTMPPAEAVLELRRTRDFLVESLSPHEEQEDREVFPLLAQAVGNDDVTAALHRTHTEIFHLIRFTDRLVSEVPARGPRTRGSHRPAAHALRPGRDPPPAHGAGGGALPGAGRRASGRGRAGPAAGVAGGSGANPAGVPRSGDGPTIVGWTPRSTGC